MAIGITGTTTLTISGAQVLAGVGAVGLIYLLSKQSKLSGKETASDKPSWVNVFMVDKKLSAHDNARDIMDNKYGVGNWNNRKREYSKILKWIVRGGFKFD